MEFSLAWAPKNIIISFKVILIACNFCTQNSVLSYLEMLILLWALITAISLYFWYLTQSLLACRDLLPKGAMSVSSIYDKVYLLTSVLHSKLVASVELANILLTFSSTIIDVLGLFFFVIVIFKLTSEPVVSIILLFTFY